MKNLTCLVKLGVAGVVSVLLAACGGQEKQITKLPASELSVSKPATDGEVIVGDVEQLADHSVRCVLGPYEVAFCGYAWLANTDGTTITFVIEDPKLALMK